MVMGKLTRNMWKELMSAEKYSKCAEAYKIEHPDIAQMYNDIAKDKIKHSKKLYDHAMKLAAKEDSAATEIPNWIMNMWKEEQKDYIEKLSKVRYQIEEIVKV